MLFISHSFWSIGFGETTDYQNKKEYITQRTTAKLFSIYGSPETINYALFWSLHHSICWLCLHISLLNIYRFESTLNSKPIISAGIPNKLMFCHFFLSITIYETLILVLIHYKKERNQTKSFWTKKLVKHTVLFTI